MHVLGAVVQITAPCCLGMTMCICSQKVLILSFAQTIIVQSQGLVAFYIAAESYVVLSDA